MTRVYASHCDRKIVSKQWKYCPYCGDPLPVASNDIRSGTQDKIRSPAHEFRSPLKRNVPLEIAQHVAKGLCIASTKAGNLCNRKHAIGQFCKQHSRPAIYDF